jgi:hypothetical protein
MQEKASRILAVLGKIAKQLVITGRFILIIALRLLGQFIVWARPRLVQMKAHFHTLPKRKQRVILACVALVLIAGFFSLRSEASYATVEECEEGACGFWAFNGKTGEGYWRNGAESTLQIEHFNPYFVNITSTRTKGPAVGLIVYYEGKRTGNRIEGKYTSVWPGHKSPPGGAWIANVDTASKDEAWLFATRADQSHDTLNHLRWLMHGVGLGDMRAQNDLGLVYATGDGVPVNYAKAQSLFRLAASQGSKQSASNLGRMYALGLGVPKDQAQANAWYRQSDMDAKQSAQGNFSTVLSETSAQAAKDADAMTQSSSSALDGLYNTIDEAFQKRQQMDAANWAACQKSQECLDRIKRERLNEELQKEQEEETREWNVHNSHIIR